MKVQVLQDHTEFMARMIHGAIDHEIGAPLNITVLNTIRAKMMVCTYRGEKVTADYVRSLADTLPAGAEMTAAAKAITHAVEGEIEAWYCIADDEGVQWLTTHPAGPVLRWNGACWWGKLKGVKLPELEIVFHEAYQPRKRSRPGRGKAAETGDERPAGAGGPGLRRTDMQEMR